MVALITDLPIFLSNCPSFAYFIVEIIGILGKNPLERVISILNLALQAVGLMMKETSAETEQKLKSANGLQQLSDIVKNPKFREDMVESIEPVKVIFGC